MMHPYQGNVREIVFQKNRDSLVFCFVKFFAYICKKGGPDSQLPSHSLQIKYRTTMKFYSAKDYSTKLKVTIQATGKLGFTAGTASALHLTPDSHVKLAGDETGTALLYLVVCPDTDEDGFKVDFTSGYYSLPTTVLFNELGIDYESYTFMYDLTRESSLDEEAGGVVYKMKERKIKRKEKKEANM